MAGTLLACQRPTLELVQSLTLVCQLFRARENGASAVGHQCSQIRVATLGNASEPSSQSGTRFLRCESQPGSHMSAIAEVVWRADGGDKGCGGEQADTGDGEQRPSRRIGPRMAVESSP